MFLRNLVARAVSTGYRHRIYLRRLRTKLLASKEVHTGTYVSANCSLRTYTDVTYVAMLQSLLWCLYFVAHRHPQNKNDRNNTRSHKSKFTP